MIETNRIEYKTPLTGELDLEKEVIAFPNYPEGGLVCVGIDKAGSIVGVADPDADMLKIKANRQDVSFAQLRIYCEEKHKSLRNSIKFTEVD